MLTYRNTRTGAVITVLCPIYGEWELVEPEKEDAKAEKPAEEVPEVKPEKKPTARKRTAKK